MRVVKKSPRLFNVQSIVGVRHFSRVKDHCIWVSDLREKVGKSYS